MKNKLSFFKALEIFLIVFVIALLCLCAVQFFNTNKKPYAYNFLPQCICLEVEYADGSSAEGTAVMFNKTQAVSVAHLFEKEVDNVLAVLTPKNALIMRVALHTGLRISDVLSLKTDQLKPNFWITEQKTGKRRQIGLPEPLLSDLLDNTSAPWRWGADFFLALSLLVAARGIP